MKVPAIKLSALVFTLGLLAAGPVMAQPSAVAPEQSPATTTHNDPIVQKRMEVRAANQQHRANRSEARSVQRAEVRESRAERNQSVQEARGRATEAINSAN
ncbi:hypothetical protein [Paraburkholderia adhaesiva]|uniref:hypothetical protein n=1 Tax=Paraburkholderia adhaesiva TaxID=2883244 RepID=UPI001F374618|nr:hypothetical protein [Paraburkholderia adhaesiva]